MKKLSEMQKEASVAAIAQDSAGMTHCSFVLACSKFFGRLAGQSLADFNAELKVLTEQDRTDLIAMFRTVGLDATKAS